VILSTGDPADDVEDTFGDLDSVDTTVMPVVVTSVPIGRAVVPPMGIAVMGAHRRPVMTSVTVDVRHRDPGMPRVRFDDRRVAGMRFEDLRAAIAVGRAMVTTVVRAVGPVEAAVMVLLRTRFVVGTSGLSFRSGPSEDGENGDQGSGLSQQAFHHIPPFS
jgi:hypothetical protein